MPYTALPLATDVTAELANMSPAVVLPSGFSVQTELDAAEEEWNVRTGYRPFFQTSSIPVSMMIDPPGPDSRNFRMGGSNVLFFPTGLLSVTSIWNLYDASNTPPTYNVLTQYQDFWLQPSEAPTQVPARPYTKALFAFPLRGNPGSIVVTGVWGYCQTNIPADAWAGIRDMAAARCLRTLREGQLFQPSMEKELDAAESYDAEILLRLGASLDSRAQRALNRYRLLSW